MTAIWENIRSAFAQLWAHWLRSALTLVGIILGVFSINAMFSLVGGISDGLNSLFETIALDNMVFVSPRRVPPEERDAFTGASLGIQPDDADAINAEIPGVLAIPVTEFTKQVDLGKAERVSVQVMGTSGEFLHMRKLEIDTGRGLLPADEIGERPVAVVGWKAAHDLFGDDDPLGKQFPLGDLRFTVVGTIKNLELPPIGRVSGIDTEGETVYVPATTARRHVVGMRSPVGLAVQIRDLSALAEAADRIEGVMLRRHRGVTDFEVENVAEELLRARGEIDEIISNLNVVLGCIAGTALLVGGLGILGIMLISIQERMFEIGLRKAVGARDWEILLQFLVESSVLSAVGAAVGSFMVMPLVLLGDRFIPTGMSVSIGGLTLSYIFAVAVGFIFGFYPAWKASRLEPVEALRAS